MDSFDFLLGQTIQDAVDETGIPPPFYLADTLLENQNNVVQLEKDPVEYIVKTTKLQKKQKKCSII